MCFSDSVTEVSNTQIIDKIAVLLVAIGALNWGSVGLFGFDFVSWALGGIDPIVPRAVFTLVGIAGIWAMTLLFRPSGLGRRDGER